MDFKRAVVDADWCLYAVAHAGEKKTIKAIEKQTGNEHDIANRTEFWGRGRSKDGGYLAELNKSRETPLTWEDFDILDIQTPDKIENVLYSAKTMVEGITKATGIKKKDLFVGEGRSFRHSRSAILEYKGQRSDALTPIYKEDVKEYLVKYHGAQIITGLEVDDVVIIEGQEKDTLVVAVDKDSMGCPVDLFNPMHPEWGVMNCRGFGKLWWDESGKKKKLRGMGRKWLYTQVLTGDITDNVKPNAASNVDFGDVSAYNALNNCSTDLECLHAIKESYLKMYPSPVTVMGWRGEVLKDIDWMYVANEVFDLVRMKRSYSDEVIFTDVLKKYGVI